MKEQRKVIANGISHNYKLKDITEALGFDPTSISKEVKRNRESTTIGKNITNCKKTQRWPYVCTGCPKKYNNQNYNCYYNTNDTSFFISIHLLLQSVLSSFSCIYQNSL